MGCELKKLMSSKIIFIVLIIGFLYGTYNFYCAYIKGSVNCQVDMTKEPDYEKCIGVYTEEKLNLLEQIVEDKMESFNDEYFMEEDFREDKDFMLFQQYNALCQKARLCRETLEYRERVKSNAKRLSQTETGYYARLNKKLQEIYDKKLVLHIYADTIGADVTNMFIGSVNIDMIYIAALVLISCFVFLGEHRNRTYTMIYSSYLGRKYTYIRKIATAFGVVLFVSVLQTVSMVGLACVKGSISEWGNSIQEIGFFMHSPHYLSVIQMIVVVTLLRAIAYMTMMAVFLWISLFFQRNLVPLAMNILIGLGGFWLTYMYSGDYVTHSGTIIPQAAFYRDMRKYSPYVLISDGIGYLKEYEAVNVFGHPIPVLDIVIIANFLFVLVVVFSGYIVYQRRFRTKGV